MKQTYFERFMLVFATIEPIATIPQIVGIWNGHDASGVSLLTWSFYTLTSLLWLTYGISKRDRPLIVSGAFWMISQSLVVIGLLVT